ncbi:MAG: hypothetical protein KDD64_09100 [Bdellovibrionales bacterium]|nr:hypothetical protein [Bdellovibrionales bacterium]
MGHIKSVAGGRAGSTDRVALGAIPHLAFDLVGPQAEFVAELNSYFRTQITKGTCSMEQALGAVGAGLAYVQGRWNSFGSEYFINNMPFGEEKSRQFAQRVLHRCVAENREEHVEKFLSDHPQHLRGSKAEVRAALERFFAFYDEQVAPNFSVKKPSLADVSVARSEQRELSNPSNGSPSFEDRITRSVDVSVATDLYARWMEHIEELASSSDSHVQTLSRIVGVVRELHEFATQQARFNGVPEEALGKAVEELLLARPEATLVGYLGPYRESEAGINFNVRNQSLLTDFYGWAKENNLLRTAWNPRVDSLLIPLDTPVGDWYYEYWEWMTQVVEATEEGRLTRSPSSSAERAIESGRLIREYINQTLQELQANGANIEAGCVLERLLDNPRERILAFLNSKFDAGETPYFAAWSNLNQTLYLFFHDSGLSDYDPRVELFIPPDTQVSHPVVKWWGEQIAVSAFGGEDERARLDTRAGIVRAKTLKRFLDFACDQFRTDGQSPPMSDLQDLLDSSAKELLDMFLEQLEKEEPTRTVWQARSMLEKDLLPGAFEAGIISFDIEKENFCARYVGPANSSVYRRYQDTQFAFATSEEDPVSMSVVAARLNGLADFYRFVVEQEGADSTQSADEIFLSAVHHGKDALVERYVSHSRGTEREGAVMKLYRRAILHDFLPWIEGGLPEATVSRRKQVCDFKLPERSFDFVTRADREQLFAETRERIDTEEQEENAPRVPDNSIVASESRVPADIDLAGEPQAQRDAVSRRPEQDLRSEFLKARDSALKLCNEQLRVNLEALVSLREEDLFLTENGRGAVLFHRSDGSLGAVRLEAGHVEQLRAYQEIRKQNFGEQLSGSPLFPSKVEKKGEILPMSLIELVSIIG